jgi:DNA mismatch repair protein MutS
LTCHSILFERTEDNIQEETCEAPDFVVDVNHDQMIDVITAGRQGYHVEPPFYTSLNDIDAIEYRQEIMRGLEHHVLYDHIQSFAQKMRTMRKQLAQADKLSYTHQKESWFVDAVETYCEAVTGLVHDVTLVDVQSHGFLAFREFVTDYANSGHFTSLLAETKTLKADASAIMYGLLMKVNCNTLQPAMLSTMHKDCGTAFADLVGSGVP